LVIGATYPGALRAVRAIAPQAWFLVPGIGAQGGDLEATIAAGLREDGLGLVISVSRGVCHAPDPRAAALQYRDQINAAREPLLNPPSLAGRREAQPSWTQAASLWDKQPRWGGSLAETGGENSPTQVSDSLILDLARIGAVRLGQFTLRSGKTSPIYIDLRLLASHPDVLRNVATAYVGLLEGLVFDRIAGIPYAALPIGTAVALETGRPLIYPRKETKSYGTRRAIEGVYKAGERAVVLDDLITTGGSKIEAIAPLEEAGLVVEDVVVLIDRESGGREELERQGYRLHAVFTLRQILDVLAAHGEISEEQREHVLAWLAES
jgi:uridine monophosphate synthetase